MENIAPSLTAVLRLLMALVLYTFLGWALYAIWRDLRKHAERLTQQQIPPIRISLSGAQSEEHLHFSQSRITFGRHPSCDWVLNEDTVSSRHARLVYHHDQWWLEDLGSRNGTFLNEERVSEAVVLTNEDIVRCGQATFAIILEEKSDQGEGHE